MRCWRGMSEEETSEEGRDRRREEGLGRGSKSCHLDDSWGGLVLVPGEGPRGCLWEERRDKKEGEEKVGRAVEDGCWKEERPHLWLEAL